MSADASGVALRQSRSCRGTWLWRRFSRQGLGHPHVLRVRSWCHRQSPALRGTQRQRSRCAGSGPSRPGPPARSRAPSRRPLTLPVRTVRRSPTRTPGLRQLRPITASPGASHGALPLTTLERAGPPRGHSCPAPPMRAMASAARRAAPGPSPTPWVKHLLPRRATSNGTSAASWRRSASARAAGFRSTRRRLANAGGGQGTRSSGAQRDDTFWAPSVLPGVGPCR